MNEIGGYIELETRDGKPLHNSSIAINSGRNGIRYAIKAYAIKDLWVPYYTCPVVWDAISAENCNIHFYNVANDLLPDRNFPIDDYILYTNYFGICSGKIKSLAMKYKNLIIDNAQGFYMQNTGIASCYSPRKFFGVSDGGYVYCQKPLKNNFLQDTSYQRFAHLLKRADCGSNFGYQDFIINDDSLIGEDIKLMSNLTQKLLRGVDYDIISEKRIKNYNYLKEHLDPINLLKTSITDDVPMYYPLLIENDSLRANLVKNKIYIPMCWKNMEFVCSKDSYELYLQKYIHPLIIDQRYNLDDMKRIVELIHEYK